MTGGTGNFLAQIAMLGFIPFCVVLFLLVHPVRAAAVGLVSGFLLLPNTSFKFSGIPDYDKLAAMTLGVLIAGFAVDTGRFFRFRPRWIDLPVFLLVLSSSVASLANDMGVWDSLSSFFKEGVRWGAPWLLGRIYFGEALAQRELASTIVAGALLYIPPCLFEIKMSPLIHMKVYGVRLLSMKHAQRGAFWKPNVFIESGLVCALFLGVATILAFYLWRTRSRRTILRIPMGVATLLLAMITVGASSSMALLVMMAGMGTLAMGRRLMIRLPLLLMVLLPPFYVGVRQFGGWDGRELVDVAEATFGERRADSLRYRFNAENLLRDRASEKKWVGWGGEQAFTQNQDRSDQSLANESIAVDSMWMWYMGLQGLFGVSMLYATLLLGGWLAYRHVPARFWGHPVAGMPMVMGLVSVLYAQDTLLNAVENQLFVVIVGSSAGSLVSRGLRQAQGLRS